MNAKSFKGYPIIALQNLEYSILIVLKWYWEAAIEDVLQKYLNMRSPKYLAHKVYSWIFVQNLWKMPAKEFIFSKVADLKRATLMKNWTRYQVFILLCIIARFSQGNKNKLRTFPPQKGKKIKNSQPQAKFTGSYKKRV